MVARAAAAPPRPIAVGKETLLRVVIFDDAGDLSCVSFIEPSPYEIFFFRAAARRVLLAGTSCFSRTTIALPTSSSRIFGHRRASSSLTPYLGDRPAPARGRGLTPRRRSTRSSDALHVRRPPILFAIDLRAPDGAARHGSLSRAYMPSAAPSPAAWAAALLFRRAPASVTRELDRRPRRRAVQGPERARLLLHPRCPLSSCRPIVTSAQPALAASINVVGLASSHYSAASFLHVFARLVGRADLRDAASFARRRPTWTADDRARCAATHGARPRSSCSLLAGVVPSVSSSASNSDLARQ